MFSFRQPKQFNSVTPLLNSRYFQIPLDAQNHNHEHILISQLWNVSKFAGSKSATTSYLDGKYTKANGLSLFLK